MKKIMWFIAGFLIIPLLVTICFGIYEIVKMFSSLTYLVFVANFVLIIAIFVPPIVAKNKWNKNRAFSVGILISSIILFIGMCAPSMIVHKNVKVTEQTK